MDQKTKVLLGWTLLGALVGGLGLLIGRDASESLGAVLAFTGFGTAVLALANLALDLIQSD